MTGVLPYYFATAGKTEATRLAKQRFGETQRISEWSHHADRLHVEEADFPF
jgi:hypothetical protein